MHGSPLSKHDNRRLWDTHTRAGNAIMNLASFNFNNKRLMLVFLYIIIVIALHLIPMGGYSINRMNFGPFRGDYLIHLICFLPWMFLLTFSSHKRKIGALKGLAWMGIGIILAVIVETIHCWLPHRSFNPMDAMFNVAGVVVGAGVFFARQKLSFVWHQTPDNP